MKRDTRKKKIRAFSLTLGTDELLPLLVPENVIGVDVVRPDGPVDLRELDPSLVVRLDVGVPVLGGVFDHVRRS